MTKARFVDLGDGFTVDSEKLGVMVGRYVNAHDEIDWDARPPGLYVRRVQGGVEVYSAARENMPELVFGVITLEELRAS